MGIAFNTLYDRILLEKSNFNRFFTSQTPVHKIHQVLRISHDTDVELSPTSNRHVLWDALREGNGLFVAEKISHHDVAKRIAVLKKTIKELSYHENIIRNYNEIKKFILTVLSVDFNGEIDTALYKKYNERLHGGYHTKPVRPLETVIKETYPSQSGEIIQQLDDVINCLIPERYIVLKRIPDTHKAGLVPKSEEQVIGPGERKFKVYPKNQGKVYGQKYTAFLFTSERLISTKTITDNAVRTFRLFFGGWGTRDFYVIEDKSFVPKKHPYTSIGKSNMYKVLPLTKSHINAFAIKTLEKYERLINLKLQERLKEIKSSMVSNINNQTGEINLSTFDVESYNNLLKIINKGILNSNVDDLFFDFMLKDTRHDLSDYELLSTKISAETNEEYLETLQDDKDDVMDEILKVLKNQSGISGSQYVKIRRIRDNQEPHIQVVPYDELVKLNIVEYEMYDDVRRSWIPIDTENFNKLRTNLGVNATYAIGFKDALSYNDFTRQFVLYVVRSLASKNIIDRLENILEDF
jgi:hypothetical protein